MQLSQVRVMQFPQLSHISYSMKQTASQQYFAQKRLLLSVKYTSRSSWTETLITRDAF
jgi:hypothetical protein